MNTKTLKNIVLGFALGSFGLVALATTIPNLFTSGTVISSNKVNENFSALGNAVTTLEGKVAALQNVAENFNSLVPVGSIVAWHKQMPGTKTLPENWVECNGQVISDNASPLNNQATPNLNGEGRFLRGAAQSGVPQDQDWKSLVVKIQAGGNNAFPPQTAAPKGEGAFSTPMYSGAWGYSFDGSSAGMSFGWESGAEIRPKNMSVVWIMRIK
jgi:hypothetical protein